MAKSGKRQRRLSDGYSFAGFRALETVRGVFGDPDVRMVTLDRRSKKGLRLLRSRPNGLVRSSAAACSRSVERRISDRSGFGGERSEASMAQFYAWLGERKCSKIRLVVMDMWKPFRNVAREKAPRAAILFDKFHILRHLGEALDKVRKAEYVRVGGKDRRFIKGQKYTLLSRRENLTLEGKRSLQLLLTANKRLNTAYVLKESFGQLWDYRRESWARRFFDSWRTGLKWQRLKPYERFADMIERHWDGIAAYCKPENKISLGFVEGLNNKIRVFQRRAYGFRDEEYLRLKVLSCMLPPL
jgi:transposase